MCTSAVGTTAHSLRITRGLTKNRQSRVALKNTRMYGKPDPPGDMSQSSPVFLTTCSALACWERRDAVTHSTSVYQWLPEKYLLSRTGRDNMVPSQQQSIGLLILSAACAVVLGYQAGAVVWRRKKQLEQEGGKSCFSLSQPLGVVFALFSFACLCSFHPPSCLVTPLLVRIYLPSSGHVRQIRLYNY